MGQAFADFAITEVTVACEDRLVRGVADSVTREIQWTWVQKGKDPGQGLTGRAGVQRRLPGRSATPLSLTGNKERES